MNVQAIISNISFPKTLDELGSVIEENGQFNVEDVLSYEVVEWTAPKWLLVGDIVFFFHAKTAIQTIRKLEANLKKENPSNFDLLMDALNHAKELYNLFGGKIFAIGRVKKRPFYGDSDWQNQRHWKSRI